MKTSAILSAIAVAVAAFAGVAYADEPVKAGANYNKASREIDDNILTSGKGFEKGEREIDDGTLPSGRRVNQPGRDFDQDALRAARDFDQPGRPVSHAKAKKKIRKKPLED
jgi:hypothetical protein